MSAERRVGSITAFRVWSLILGEDKLCSVAVGCDWDGPVLSTDPPYDNLSDHLALYRTFMFATSPPRYGQDVGIHATKLTRKGIGVTAYYDPPVAGVVKLFGKVVEHEHGYRAQHCMIEHLFLAEEYRDRARGLEARYGCTVDVVPSFVMVSTPLQLYMLARRGYVPYSELPTWILVFDLGVVFVGGVRRMFGKVREALRQLRLRRGNPVAAVHSNRVQPTV